MPIFIKECYFEVANVRVCRCCSGTAAAYTHPPDLNDAQIYTLKLTNYMTNYLKYRSPWLQLVIFGSLVIGILFVAGVIGILIIAKWYNISALGISNPDFSNPSVVSALKAMQAVSTIAIFLVPPLVFAYLSDKNPLKYAGFKKPAPALFYIISVLIILFSVPMVAWLSNWNQHMHLPQSMEGLEKAMRDSENQNDGLLKSFLIMRSRADLAAMLLLIAVLPAVAEELFFRGILQRLFIQMTKRPWAGIVLTAIIFSAVHVQFLGFFPRVALGIVLGALYWYSGSLWPGIIAHFINNGLQVILVYSNPKMLEKDPDFSAPLIAFSTIAVIALIWWMHRLSQTTYAEVYDTDDFHIGPRDQYIA